MKRKFLLILSVMLMTVLCSCGSTTEKSSEPVIEDTTDYNVVQTEMSNFICRGNYHIKDGWLYTISSPEDGTSAIFAKQRIDGSEYSVLTEKGTPSFIKVDGEYIYFIIGNPESSKIYRCRLGGDDLKKLVDSNVWELQVEGDYLYYNKLDKNGAHAKYYRCKKDGTGEEIVLDKEIYYSYIVNNILYYQDDNDGETIHRYNLDTKEDEKITDGYSYAFVTDGKYGYYIRQNKSSTEGGYKGNLTRIDLETKEEITLYKGGASGEVMAVNDTIYYINANDENRIYSIDKNGENIKLISQDTNCNSLAVYEDKLMYMDLDEKNERIEAIYICNLDGSDKVNIVE